jgi:FKBP-type peptidyl-prolyl cis-trans isomerase (trigger factor)
MKNSFKKLPGSKIELEVSLDQKEFLPYYQAAYDEAVKNVHLKGFRPGTAPKDLADGAVDKEKVFSEAAKNAIRWSLDEITKDNEWTLVDGPKITVEDSKDLGIVYKAELSLFPEIKLGNYKKIAKKVLGEKKEQAVGPKEIEQTLEWIRNQRKRSLPAGRQGDKIPELNDDFAKSVGKFENMETLKKSVSEGVLMEKNMKEQDRLRLKILDELIKDSQLDLPEIMIEKTYDSLIRQYGQTLKAGGKTEDQIKTEIRERARNNVVTNLVIYQIAKAEKLEPTPEEVRAREGSVENDANYQYIYGVLQNEKVFQFLENFSK